MGCTRVVAVVGGNVGFVVFVAVVGSMQWFRVCTTTRMVTVGTFGSLDRGWRRFHHPVAK